MSRNIRVFRWPIMYARKDFKKREFQDLKDIYGCMWESNDKQSLTQDSLPFPLPPSPSLPSKDDKGLQFLKEAICLREKEKNNGKE